MTEVATVPEAQPVVFQVPRVFPERECPDCKTTYQPHGPSSKRCPACARVADLECKRRRGYESREKHRTAPLSPAEVEVRKERIKNRTLKTRLMTRGIPTGTQVEIRLDGLEEALRKALNRIGYLEHRLGIDM